MEKRSQTASGAAHRRWCALTAVAAAWLLGAVPRAEGQQAGAAASPPDPAYASIGAVRLTTDILPLPANAELLCGTDTAFLRSRMEAAFRNSGVRVVTTAPPPGAPDPERAAMPELSATLSIAFDNNGICVVSYQFLLLAPIEATRVRANRVPVESGLLLLWGHNGLARKPASEIAAEVEDAILSEVGKLAREFARANAARVAVPPQAAVVPRPTAPQVACPDRWQELGPAARTRLECTCTAEAVARGSSVWGTDIYTDDSAVCRAALHAGAVLGSGGPVIVLGEAGRPSYTGTARNGVSTSSYGTWNGSFRFERRAPASAPINSDAQKPPPAPAPRGR